MFPELTYMLKALVDRNEFGALKTNSRGLKMLRTSLDREYFNNQAPSSLLAKDSRGINALRSASPGICEEMDAELEKALESYRPPKARLTKSSLLAKRQLITKFSKTKDIVM